MKLEITNKKPLVLRSPKLGFIWIGAVVSSSIPMIMATSMLWPYINYIKWGCKSSSASGRCLQYWPDRNEPQLWEFPVGFTCFIFTPIVCWICCRYVLRMIDQNALSFGELAKFTVTTALKWQVIAGGLHLIILGVLEWEELWVALVIGLVAVIVHFFISIMVTAPLSLICVSVFSLVALKKGN